jgi:hypothetical protein
VHRGWGGVRTPAKKGRALAATDQGTDALKKAAWKQVSAPPQQQNLAGKKKKKKKSSFRSLEKRFFLCWLRLNAGKKWPRKRFNVYDLLFYFLTYFLYMHIWDRCYNF